MAFEIQFEVIRQIRPIKQMLSMRSSLLGWNGGKNYTRNRLLRLLFENRWLKFWTCVGETAAHKLCVSTRWCVSLIRSCHDVRGIYIFKFYQQNCSIRCENYKYCMGHSQTISFWRFRFACIAFCFYYKINASQVLNM